MTIFENALICTYNKILQYIFDHKYTVIFCYIMVYFAIFKNSHTKFLRTKIERLNMDILIVKCDLPF